MKIFLTLTLLLLASTASAGQITFEWDASAEQPASYKLYYGTDPAFLDRTEDVSGTETKHTVKGLTAGDTVFA